MDEQLRDIYKDILDAEAETAEVIEKVNSSIDVQTKMDILSDYIKNHYLISDGELALILEKTGIAIEY